MIVLLLIRVHETGGDWERALKEIIPRRKGDPDAPDMSLSAQKRRENQHHKSWVLHQAAEI